VTDRYRVREYSTNIYYIKESATRVIVLQLKKQENLSGQRQLFSLSIGNQLAREIIKIQNGYNHLVLL